MSDLHSESNVPLNCEQVDLLLSADIEEDPDLTSEERSAVAAHLDQCPACRETYEGDRELMLFAREHWHEIMAAPTTLEGMDDRVDDEHGREHEETFDVEAGWQGLLQRCPELGRAHSSPAQQPHRYFRPAVRPALAIVASLGLVFGLGWFIRGLNSPSNSTDALGRPAATSVQSPTLGQHPTIATTSPENPLASVGDATFLQNIPNLDSLDYREWRDSHAEWFARQFPWIAKVQAALAEKGIQADSIDMLMVSGDIWQFHYVSSGSVDQPLAVMRAAGLMQLAQHYGIDADWLKGKILNDPPNASILAEPDNSELQHWLSDLSEAASRPSGISMNLLLISMRTGTYLANTRTAVYLWGKAHPEQFTQLLVRPEVRRLLGLPADVHPLAKDGLSVLAQQVAAAQSLGQISSELLMLPPRGGCVQTTARSKAFISCREACCLCPAVDK